MTVRPRPRGDALSRRCFFCAAAGIFAGCASAGTDSSGSDPVHITARPLSPRLSIDAGEHRLGIDSGRDGLLFVPRARRPTGDPLVVMLHGAGGNATGMRSAFTVAEEFGVVVLAPDSRARTWDGIRGRIGRDVEFIDTALRRTFERVAVDPRRLGIGGFSDGASYGLALAIANGDLISHVLAFSPGFIPTVPRRGKPHVFISHGTQDDVLPVEQTSRTIVPELESRGYDVRYREFGGPHTVPRAIAREAFDWFTR